MFAKHQYIEYLIATTGNYIRTNRVNHLKGDQVVSHDTITITDKGIHAQTILFDNWYASVENLKLIHRA